MKKFFMNLFGIEATAKNICGKKSSGIEDYSTYQHWKAPGNAGNGNEF